MRTARAPAPRAAGAPRSLAPLPSAPPPHSMSHPPAPPRRPHRPDAGGRGPPPPRAFTGTPMARPAHSRHSRGGDPPTAPLLDRQPEPARQRGDGPPAAVYHHDRVEPDERPGAR